MEKPKRLRKRCKNCLQPIQWDGYGEPVHVETNRYQCESGETVAE